ncbi:PREDICTED: matrix metalloproteinase-14-like [Trachymyrmex cornetzi]|uniref:matrix metalloproteinase-14-like n=1 Tax=Trachymyrmex cornetzi TaxID=471704 RepID=UPI00084F5EDA|nr:PREDICTED: matrix metalloproteinase-14-like [Trachymyrmex cornetzi]
MRKPRCGLPDIPHHEHNTANSSLTFERKILNPNILISYRSGTHTYVDRKRNAEICPSSFDGRGGVLAHAFYSSHDPNYTTEIHVDNAEAWHIYLDGKISFNSERLLHTLTHEIGHSLGLMHSSREDSAMFAFAKNTNTTVKLNLEDILAIQHLYGSNKPGITTTTTTTTTKPPTTITEIPTNKPDKIDLCELQYVDTILILNHRIFVTYQGYAWSININDNKYDGPFELNTYMNFLPKNFSLSAAYQRPSGEIVLFINDMVYMVNYPSFKLKEGWQKHLKKLGFPPNVVINTARNTHKGQTYVIFDDNDVAQIDECTLTVNVYQTLQSIFPGIPSSPTMAFRHMDGNIYFAKKQQFYQYIEFKRTVTKADKFSIKKILNTECSRDGLLQQLQDILNQFIQYS